MKKYSIKLSALFLSLLISLSGLICAGAVGLEDVYLIGDVNLDGAVDVRDATDLQRHIASIASLDGEGLKKADTNYDNLVDVRDATHIQKIVAKVYVPLTAKKGVDVSNHNGDIDIEKIRNAGYDFVMIRCGFGNDTTSQDDKRFEQNVRKCEEAGMPWGVYLYSYALTVKEAKSELQHTLRLLKGKKPTLPVAFDMEDADGYKKKHGMPSQTTLDKICMTYLTGIRDAGYYPMLYMSMSWVRKVENKSLLSEFDIWLAQWNTECSYDGGTLGIWQYGGSTNYLESNSIEGIGTIDKNFCYKDYPLLIMNQHYNNW
ncbi:MAG: hypothetical protein IIU14_00835 [Ruminococcus sp.]|nr:hypothetical protein [Ruminococcus sp.]